MKKTAFQSATRVLIFMSVFSLFVYVANLVVYEALAGMFALIAPWQLWLLGGILGGFSASFILANLIGMRFYTAFSRTYYYISAIWMGFFAYLFLLSVVYGFLLMVIAIPMATSVGLVLLASAAVASIYGVLHARNIQVTLIEVTLPNLPEIWRGRKAVWVSDIHLGQIHGPKFAEKIVKKVNALPHDIIFIGGDLYDGTGAPDIVELAAPLAHFSAPLGTYFITGNHEEIGDASAFIAAVQAVHIKTLIDEMVEIDGLQLIGVDYRNASDKERFTATLAGFHIDLTKPSILLKHEPKDLDIARDAGISFQVSGHTHLGQQWPLGYIAKLIYKGFAYGLKKLGDMQVYTSSGVGTWGPPLRVGTNCEIVHITFR